MDYKYLIGFCKNLYAQKRDETECFINSVADFLLANRENPAIVSEEFKSLILPLYNLWTTNVLSELKEGRLFISEAFLNNLLGVILARSSTIKTADINCYGNGSMDCMIEHRMGRFLIKGEIVECINDAHKSNLVLCINEKRALNGGLSKLFSSLAMNMVNNLLEKNLNMTCRNGIKLIYASDILTIDFRDFLKNVSVNRYEILDKRPSELVHVLQALVVDGGVELRLKYNVND